MVAEARWRRARGWSGSSSSDGSRMVAATVRVAMVMVATGRMVEEAAEEVVEEEVGQTEVAVARGREMEAAPTVEAAGGAAAGVGDVVGKMKVD